jgi:cobalt-zinc-cadmium efflux system outer membrane protein
MKSFNIKAMRKIILLYIILLSVQINLSAQERLEVNAGKSIELSLKEFLSYVSKGNLGYISEHFNVSMAEAALKAARIFPDPEISLSYSDNQDKSLKMGRSMETSISYPVSLGNKRGAGIALARSQYELSILALEEFFNNLRADAALGYYSALRAKKEFELETESYFQMKKLAVTDSIRLRAGEITEIDAMQSALEAEAQLTEVVSRKCEMQNSSTDLGRLAGSRVSDTLICPLGEFVAPDRNFSLSQLIENALANKTAVRMAIKNREISDNNLRMIKAGRAPEFNLEAGYSYNYEVRNEIAPAPSFHSYSAGISIPLKFSNVNRQEIKAAKYGIMQSEANLKDVELQIASDVTKAYNSFLSERERLLHYNSGLIVNAEKILKGRIYAYQRGESGLVDVINARRGYNELKRSYLESLFNYTAALIELERAAGVWDLE